MAAGGGSGVSFLGVNGVSSNSTHTNGLLDPSSASAPNGHHHTRSGTLDNALRALRIDTDVDTRGHQDEVSSATSTSTTASMSDRGLNGSVVGSEREIWAGEMSAVVGLQKRGLRGLMEGRRIREMGRGGSSRAKEDGGGGGGGGGGVNGGDGVGLGLMGPAP
jgi:hypothetical protein